MDKIRETCAERLVLSPAHAGSALISVPF